MSDLDVYKEGAYLPEGPPPGSDLSMIRPGVILELDTVGNRIRVSYNGGEGAWCGALPGMYTPKRTCWVLVNPFTGRAELVLSQIDGTSNSNARAARLVSVNTTTKTAVVTLAGVDYTIPFQPNAYTVGSLVWVLCNPTKWGAPELLLGPCDFAPEDPEPEPVPTPGETPTTIQAETTIFPQWSGTWRASRGAWDRWNESAYGGASDLYQGSSFGSGPLTGLATYGDQLVNLGAISIDAVGVSIVHNGGSAMPGPPVLQGSPQGSRPAGGPVGAGETVTGFGGVWLPASIRDGMRTGAVKGLALVGGGYYGARGTSHPQGMALTVTYTRSA